MGHVNVTEGLRDRVGAELFRRVAGPDGERRRELIHGAVGVRWFEPDSPIARVHGDASMFVGGIRAVMLQSLHPAAMQGVADHSGYRGDMWGRLANVANYIAVTTFGTEHHATAAINAVSRVHERVVGTMPDGTPYAANDPRLLGWVHAAEIDSFLTAHDLYGHQPLTADERDTYVEQAAHVAGLLGVTSPPRSAKELEETLADFRPELAGTDAARDAIAFLINEPELPLAALPAYRSMVAAAVALMPVWTRDELGLSHHPILERTASRALGRVATVTIRWAMSEGHAEARRIQEAAAS